MSATDASASTPSDTRRSRSAGCWTRPRACAARRKGKLAVVVKDGGIPTVSALWRDLGREAASRAGVAATFVDIDLAAYRLVSDPLSFDVLAAPNLFGDVLADVGAVLLASRGMSFSGNFSESGAAVYQTNHGSALDLAGQGRANPIGQISSIAMMLRESFGLGREAAWIEAAVEEVLRLGFRTFDIAEPGSTIVGTAELGRRVAAESSAGRTRATDRRRPRRRRVMRPLALFVDLQNDFLGAAGARAPFVGGRAQRGAPARRSARPRPPVVHAVTSVDPESDDRMPHWKALGVRKCVRGTPGHRPPPELAPRAGEPVVSKTFFSAFSAPELEAAPRRGGHAARRRRAPSRLRPGHGARRLRARPRRLGRRGRGRQRRPAPRRRHAPISRRTGRAVRAGGRAARHARAHGAAPGPDAGRYAAEAARASAAAREAAAAWRAAAPEERARPLEALAERLEAEAPALGSRSSPPRSASPSTLGEAEVRRTAELLRARRGAAGFPGLARPGRRRRSRRVPLGVVAVVTPWNNPLAIPWGKIGPALALGNTVVWKPAPAGTRLAERSLEAARDAGLPEGVVTLVPGDRRAAAAGDERSRSGRGVRVGLLRGRLGGAGDLRAPPDPAPGGARRQQRRDRLGRRGPSAHGAVSWRRERSRSRASAVRRTGASIVAGSASSTALLELLSAAAATLPWGDPLDPATRVGPLVSEEARDRVAAALARAAADGARLVTPHTLAPSRPGSLVSPDHRGRRARTRARSSRKRLSARSSCSSAHRASRRRSGSRTACGRDSSPRSSRDRVPGARAFQRAAAAGILKWNASTADADADAPFGGWKASGLGPPEHGPGDVEFYSRLQAIYDGALL